MALWNRLVLKSRKAGFSVGPDDGINREVVTQRCQLCGNMGMTRFVAFYRNVGMLLARRTYTIVGNLCESCVHKNFWKFEALDVLLGPWGTLSIFLTPIYLVQNIFTYIFALYKFSRAKTEGDGPQASGFPLLKTLAVIGFAALVLLAVRAVTTRERASVLAKSHTQQDQTTPPLPPEDYTPLSASASAVACGSTLKLDTAMFTKLDLVRRLDDIVNNSGYTKDEIKNLAPDPPDDLNKEAFQAYSLAYLTWDKPKKVSRATLDKAVSDAVNSPDLTKLSPDERAELDVYWAKFRNMMLRAFELGRHDARLSPCPN
jgi:hypothetical protein